MSAFYVELMTVSLTEMQLKLSSINTIHLTQ